MEGHNSALAGTAQDALSNVMVVQSFTRLQAELRMFGDIARELIRNQFPVLNWWALVNVMTRAGNTIAVITIVVVGTWLHMHGQASLGEIVSFMGIAMLLIGKLETAGAFVSSLVLQAAGGRAILRGAGCPQPGAGASRAPASCGCRAARCGSRTSPSAIPAACRC